MRRTASAAVTALLVAGLLTVPASAAQARKGDRTPPRLKVTSYSMQDNRLTVAVAASDASGVRAVSLLVRGKIVATDTTAPYQLSADLSAYPGEVKWKVRAIDRRGNDRVSEERKSRVKPRPDRNRPRPAPSVSPSVSPTVTPTVSPTVSPTGTAEPEPTETVEPQPTGTVEPQPTETD
ncbi:Ig-like domain-containing protein [Catenuloplanes atrovinosus]|uniref:Uncharacterized protein n=1 Tax=Catenuloplanes atrovinosus TaxID=137266 RepID=A0AAE4CA16_9ACTN|nr:Ig-like domain-containing protein [Catenuloplanes atrovinosus]MDR7276417.1 hypothetical protein [Catenuloplanes atrovinosus]